MASKPNSEPHLLESIHLNGLTIGFSCDPNAPLPYIMWQQTSSGSYSCRGRFATLVLAHQHLVQHAIDLLPDTIKEQLIQANLSENLRSTIYRQAREDLIRADIESCLQDAAENLGCDPSVVPALLDNQAFRTAALRIYLNQDHSNEMDALTACFEILISNDFPDALPKVFTATLKIPPEELEIQHDILTMPLSELSLKYGDVDLGEGMLSFHQHIRSSQRSCDIEINIIPKPSLEQDNRIEVRVFTGSDSKPWTRRQIAETILTGVTDLEQIYSCTDETGVCWQLDLHADERLRRVSRQYIFHTDSDDPLYALHNGQSCIVERRLTTQEADMLCSNMMWKVCFDDGIVLDAFDNELTLPYALRQDLEQNPARQKPHTQCPLVEKIEAASSQVHYPDAALTQNKQR